MYHNAYVLQTVTLNMLFIENEHFVISTKIMHHLVRKLFSMSGRTFSIVLALTVNIFCNQHLVI